MKSGFYCTNLKRINSRKLLNLFFKYIFFINGPKNAISIAIIPLWFPYDFLMIFPMISLWFPYDFPMIFLWFTLRISEASTVRHLRIVELMLWEIPKIMAWVPTVSTNNGYQQFRIGPNIRGLIGPKIMPNRAQGAGWFNMAQKHRLIRPKEWDHCK